MQWFDDKNWVCTIKMLSDLLRVTVTLNVNNSVEDEETPEYDSSKTTEAQDAQDAQVCTGHETLKHLAFSSDTVI